MKVVEVDLSQPAQRRRFLELPFRLYAGSPQWVPPLEMDAKRMLNRSANPFYRHSEAAFFLAEGPEGARRVGAGPLGRLAVLENRHYNQYNHTRTAFFCLFECANDPEASGALFEAGCAWARANGLDEIAGPKGFTALDGVGLLVRGFEHRPAMGIPYNLPYYPGLVEAAGFVPDGDTVSGYIDRSFCLPEKIGLAARAVQERKGLRVQRFRSRADLRAFVPRLHELYNSALEGTTGNVPLTADEAHSMAEQILWFANPRLIKLILKDDDLAGFLFAYPDISPALQRTRGRLWPLGWLDLWTELRRSKFLNVNGAGILPRYRGLGATALLFSEMHASVLEGGFEAADLVQIGMENERMLNELRSFNIQFYKTHRMYKKPLV